MIATFNGTQITALVPIGTDVTALIATFTHTGTGVAVGATPQASGVTPNDFTNPVTYVVTAADSSTKSYTVTVLTPRRFAMPHVRISAGGAPSPVTTVLRAYYAGLTAPSSANVTVRLYDAGGNVITGSSSVCNPCTGTIDATDRSYILDFAAVAGAAGVTTALDGYAIVEVTGDKDRVVVVGTTETRPNNSANVIPDVAAVIEPTATGAHRLFIGPGSEDNATSPTTAGGYDTRLTFLHANGAAGAAASIALRLYTTGGALMNGSSVVCNPCTFDVGTGFTARTEDTVDNLRALHGALGAASFLGVADVSGAGAADVIVVAEREQGTTGTPSVVSRSQVPVHHERTGGPTFVRFVSPDLQQSSEVDQTYQVASFGGLGTGSPPTATVTHKVYNSATGAPQLGTNGQPICNPSCGGTIGAGFQLEASNLATFGAPQGGVPAGASTFVVTEVNGTAAEGVFANQRTTSTASTSESAGAVPAAPGGVSFMIPHVLEKSGTITTTPNTFDSTLFMTYAGGLPTGSGTGATVDLYLFDQNTGGPLQGMTGAVCNPCSQTLDTSNRKLSIRVDDLITSNGGGFDTAVKLGFGVVTIAGDADNVAIESYVINARTGPFDLSVYGFEPQPIAAPP